MDDGRRRKPRYWLAVASFAGTAMAAVILGGPANAATHQHALTRGQYPVSHATVIFFADGSDTQGPIGGNN